MNAQGHLPHRISFMSKLKLASVSINRIRSLISLAEKVVSSDAANRPLVGLTSEVVQSKQCLSRVLPKSFKTITLDMLLRSIGYSRR